MRDSRVTQPPITQPPATQTLATQSLITELGASSALPTAQRARLQRLVGQPLANLAYTQRNLPSNGAGVEFVQHHRFDEPDSLERWEFVEKSLCRSPFYASREARFYRHYGMLSACRQIAFPALRDVVETPRRCRIYSEYIQGAPPTRTQIASTLARGIAELESVSAGYLHQATPLEALDYWIMDFFRWPYLRHTRLNYQRHLGNLQKLGQPASELKHYRRRLRELEPWLGQLAREAKHSQRCISHLDYAAKNMLVSGDKLYLLDWSEVKVGRFGFDGGDYLSKLFAHEDLARFMALREEFEAEYIATLDTHQPVSRALNNMRYFFVLTALWRCLQPRLVLSHAESHQGGVLLEKLEYLLQEPQRCRADPVPTATAGDSDTAAAGRPESTSSNVQDRGRSASL